MNPSTLTTYKIITTIQSKWVQHSRNWLQIYKWSWRWTED